MADQPVGTAGGRCSVAGVADARQAAGDQHQPMVEILASNGTPGGIPALGGGTRRYGATVDHLHRCGLVSASPVQTVPLQHDLQIPGLGVIDPAPERVDAVGVDGGSHRRDWHPSRPLDSLDTGIASFRAVCTYLQMVPHGYSSQPVVSGFP